MFGNDFQMERLWTDLDTSSFSPCNSNLPRPTCRSWRGSFVPSPPYGPWVQTFTRRPTLKESHLRKGTKTRNRALPEIERKVLDSKRQHVCPMPMPCTVHFFVDLRGIALPPKQGGISDRLRPKSRCSSSVSQVGFLTPRC